MEPIRVKEIKTSDGVYKFNPAITIDSMVDSDNGELYIAEYSDFDMFVYAETPEDIINEVKEHISWLLSNIASADDENLASSAIRIKNTILSMGEYI